METLSLFAIDYSGQIDGLGIHGVKLRWPTDAPFEPPQQSKIVRPGTLQKTIEYTYRAEQLTARRRINSYRALAAGLKGRLLALIRPYGSTLARSCTSTRPIT